GVIDQGLRLIGRNIDECRIVPDFGDGGVMKDCAPHAIDFSRYSRECPRSLFGILVEPQLDLETHRRLGIVLKGLPPIVYRLRRYPVLRTPWPDIDQEREELAPFRLAARHVLAALIAAPEAEQLLQRLNIGHGEV